MVGNLAEEIWFGGQGAAARAFGPWDTELKDMQATSHEFLFVLRLAWVGTWR